MPRHPGTNLFEIGILPVDYDLAQEASITVCFVAIDLDSPIKDQLAQVFFGTLAERLRLFRGIYAGQADFVLLILRVENGNGITIADADNAATQSLGEGRTGQQAKQDETNEWQENSLRL